MPTVNVNENPGSSNESNESGNNPQESEPSTSGTYECNICLDVAKEPVVSFCGHLFCWPCLHQWLQTRPNNQTCPVCKAAISKDKVVPLYGRGNESSEDPRKKVPPRPQGQRTEHEPQNTFMNGFGFGDGGGGGFQFHLGVGAFPFGFMTLVNGRGLQGQVPPDLGPDLAVFVKLFLFVVIFISYWNLIFG